MTNPLIEQKVKELAESLPIAVRWSHGALEDPYHSLIRQALLDVAQQVRLDTLQEVEKGECLELRPWKHAECQQGECEICDDCLQRQETNRRLKSILSHIASLKQQPL